MSVRINFRTIRFTDPSALHESSIITRIDDEDDLSLLEWIRDVGGSSVVVDVLVVVLLDFRLVARSTWSRLVRDKG